MSGPKKGSKNWYRPPTPNPYDYTVMDSIILIMLGAIIMFISLGALALIVGGNLK